MDRLVYFFGNGSAEGNASMKDELGGKGANLAEMCRIGLPVPAGLTVSTRMCEIYLKQGALPESLKQEVTQGLSRVGEVMGSFFADPTNPLLISVRSGSRVSMPGMMDTILNLGLNDQTVEVIADKTKNPRFAYDSYRRFIQMYAHVVKNLAPHYLEDALEHLKKEKNCTEDHQLSAEDLKSLVKTFQGIYKRELRTDFPQDPWVQLWSAMGAVFESWNSNRAIKYRQIHGIADNWGTAVNLCAMVFGNQGTTSGTGVCFTRDPATGQNIFYGEYLLNAQGEDVVAGIRTPKPLSQLHDELPEVYQELIQIRQILEQHYRDVQDIEFTIQEKKLYLLQTRSAKRTAQAALKIAVDLVTEGVLTKAQALGRLNPSDLDQLLHPSLDPKAHKQVIAKGLPASPGAVSGRIVFTAADAESWAERGEAVILVRNETSPEDIGGMHASKGFLTARGGMTSHAAVVARQMGKCCVAGCSETAISAEEKTLKTGTTTLKEGDWITLEGSTGEVILGQMPTQEAAFSPEFETIMAWSKEVCREAQGLGVRANADTPKDAATARRFGAEGIGLCRTEHMFFEEDRLPLVRQMILAQNATERAKAIDQLLLFQRDDFVGILSAMAGFPVTIRLLDPPLHEFLPHTEQDITALALKIGLRTDDMRARVNALHEANPMLGHRGCRLGISHPEIYEMQVKAITQAVEICHQQGKQVYPEIMIPLISSAEELHLLRERLQPLAPAGIPFGTMIEVPRATLMAQEIAPYADFFSFGTNDLTQTTYGLSRDDAGSFLGTYLKHKIFPHDPFAVLDTQGVGQLMRFACAGGRKVKPSLKLGICGEHGGEPQSISFCHTLGLSYVSCSPFRVPIAILAAARATFL